MFNKEEIKTVRQLIKSGDVESVKKMMKNNRELLDAETPYGTWLEVSADLGQIELVRYFMESGIDVNKGCGITDGGPIKCASFEGYLDIVKLLYESGAKLDVSTADKNPLLAAIYNNHVEVAKFLIDKGIDLTVTYPIGSIDNCDAHEYARQYGSTEIAKYIEEKMKA